MKYSDIPQFIKSGHYQVNVPLNYFEKWLNESIEDGLVLNPDFQRGHVWSEEQQIAYIEYLFRGGKSGRILYFNCPNFHSGGRDDYVCVDGLQRITAIMRFLHNEIPIFGTYYSDFDGAIPLDIDVIANVNNLKNREDVLRWYLEMNSGGTPHTKEELEKVENMLKEMQKGINE